HASGIGPMTPIAKTTVAELAQVVLSKATAARHLHDALGDHPLDAFVLFSSGASAWGGGQQGAYAAANAFLDALAEHRRALGWTATSIAWGAWAGRGMAESPTAHDDLRRRGIGAMEPGRAVAALAQAVAANETTVTVADIDWARFAPLFAAARPRPLLAD